MTITDVAATLVTQTSAQIAWKTDLPASSAVLLLDNGLWQPYRRVDGSDAALVTEHSVLVDGLAPGTQYTFAVCSTDAPGDVGCSVAFKAGETEGSPSTFTTALADAAAPMDFQIGVSGPRSVTAGSDLYLDCATQILAGAPANLVFESVSGLPAGISFHLICGYNTNPADERADSYWTPAGQPFVYNGSEGAFAVRLRVASTVHPGSYTAKFSVRAGGVRKTVEWTLSVKPAPGIRPLDISKWERTMVTLADKWAAYVDSTPMAFGVESQPWYYDGGRVFYQIADYTGEAKYAATAEKILAQYGAWVMAAGGKVPGYRKFPAGLLMQYRRSNGVAGGDAIKALYDSVSDPYINGAAPCRGQAVDPTLVRELAYAIDCMVAGERIGLARSPFLARAVDGALGVIEQLYGSAPWQFNQTFMGGLLLEALIGYYGLTFDPRVPRAVRSAIEWIWRCAVKEETGQMSYAALYEPRVWLTDLNNLVAPAFAWYAMISGDREWQRRGDVLFAHALDTDISYSGKVFCQNYRWSFDFLRWRSGMWAAT